jgi:hypothetical protein
LRCPPCFGDMPAPSVMGRRGPAARHSKNGGAVLAGAGGDLVLDERGALA